MILTTIGSAYWAANGRRQNPVTATLASFFIDRDAGRPETDLASRQSIDNLCDEIGARRTLIEARLG